MTSHKIAVEIDGRAHAHAVATAMQDLISPAPEALTLFESGQGKDLWTTEAYFSAPQDAGALRAAIKDVLGLEDLPPFAAVDVPDRNWVAISQQALPPVHAGRFTVHGSHDRGRVPRGPNAIEIDAGEAFGTAHHATTFGCLSAIDRLTRRRPFRRVLDLGCGSGVLAIALARTLPRARITASDLDERSVAVARQNMRENRVAQRITSFRAAGLEHPKLRVHPPFDLIVSNILAEPLIRLAPNIARKLRARGALVLSGILLHEAPAVIAAYQAQGFALVRQERVTGWVALEFAKRGIAPKQGRP